MAKPATLPGGGPRVRVDRLDADRRNSAGPSDSAGWTWSSNFWTNSKASALSVKSRSRNQSGVSSRAPKCLRRAVAASSMAVLRLQQPAPGVQADVLGAGRAPGAGRRPAGGRRHGRCRPAGSARRRAGRGRGCGHTRRHRPGPCRTANRTAAGRPRAGRASGRRACSNFGTLVSTQTTNSSTGRLPHADQPGHPGRLDLAERGAEVGLEALGGELGAPGRSGPAPAAPNSGRGLRRQRSAKARSFRSDRPLPEVEGRPVVLAGFMIEDVVGDPGGAQDVGSAIAASTSAAASA